MTSKKNPKVDEVMAKLKTWPRELARLREILLDTPLAEERKWYQPCYTWKGANVVIIGEFKDHCILSFFKGSLLKDKKKLLVQPGEHTQSGRYIPFTAVEQIDDLESTIRAYIKEAIANEDAGLKVELKKTEDYPVPDELQQVFGEDPDYEVAFKALTPGRQRGWLLQFAGAKQSKTRLSRIEKARDRIFAGKGIHDD